MPSPAREHPVVVLHGLHASMQWGFFPTVIRRLTDEGYKTIPIDLALPTPSQEVDLVHKRIEETTQGPVHYLGHSRGSAIAQIVARERNIVRERVVVWSGIGKWMRSRFQMDTDYVQDTIVHSQRLDLVNAAKAIRGRVQYIHASADLTVPEREIRHLLQQAQNEEALTVFPGSTHTFGITDPMTTTTATFNTVLNRTISFFQP